MSARALLDRLIDFAGTFPPAALPLEGAVAEYRRLQASGAGWLVGPLLVRSLDVEAAGDLLGDDEVDLAVALVGSSLADDLELVSRRRTGMRLVQVEVSLPIDPAVVRAGRSWDDGVVLYAELAGPGPLADQLSALPPLAETLAGVAEVRAKVRTGGATAQAVPSPAALADLMVGCHRHGLAFKATAGLHAPLRHLDEPTGGHQHGFLNVLAGASVAADGGPASLVVEALDAQSVEDLGWAGNALAGIGTSPFASPARALFRSFGSCSAAEPIEHLEHLGLLDPDGSPAAELW